MDEALPVDNELPSILQRHRYRVLSVERTTRPDGAQGDEWYRYVLASGHARITGLHRGTLEEVTAYARTCAEEFNLRSAITKSGATTGYRKKAS